MTFSLTNVAFNPKPTEGRVVHPTSLKNDLKVAISDATQTAMSSAELLAPLSVAPSYVNPIRVEHALRAVIMARASVATAGVTTSPAVRVYGVKGTLKADKSGWENGAFAHRLDNADFDSSLNITPAFAASPSTSNTFNSGGYFWSDPKPDWDGIDCRGYDYILVLPAVAAVLTGTGATMEVVVLGVN